MNTDQLVLFTSFSILSVIHDIKTNAKTSSLKQFVLIRELTLNAKNSSSWQLATISCFQFSISCIPPLPSHVCTTDRTATCRSKNSKILKYVAISCLAFPCPAISCLATWSLIFMSCIFSAPISPIHALISTRVE